MHIRVAGIQMPVIRNIDSNVRHIEDGIQWASSRNADILLTPEGSLSGYTHEFDPFQVEEALKRVTKTAAASGLGLALGTCFVEDDGDTYNQLRFYTSKGRYLGFHCKTLPTGSLAKPPTGEINHYAIRPLQVFGLDQIKVGGLICNDMWANPTCTPQPDTHLSRRLAELGARVIFHAVNGGRSSSEWSDVNWDFHSSNLRMRARASRLWIVTVDNCEPVDIRCSAPSGVIDPHGNWRVRTTQQGIDRFVYDIRL